MLETALSFARAGAHHLILMMAASDGPNAVRRLATEVAEPLREQLG